MTSIDRAMTVGASRYADALEELARFGPAQFTQTGGMCAALELTLERGYLLVTDAEDSLPWQPRELIGWGVGFYASQDVSEGPEVFVSSGSTDTESLHELVTECLRAAAARATTRAGGGGPTCPPIAVGQLGIQA